MRPSPANAPGPQDAVEPPVPPQQVVAEAVCLFLLPGGGFGLAGKLGFGFLGRSMMAGAVVGAGNRAAADLGRGRLSEPLLYIHDTQWWLNARGRMVLYRGQVLATAEILSPLAREQGLPASRAFVDELLSAGLTRQELADFTARYHVGEVPPRDLPPGLSSNRPGVVGIPTTAIPGIAADAKYSGAGGTVYVILVPRAQALLANGWPVFNAEAEHVILNQVPAGSIVRAIPSGEIGPLWVDESGRLIAGQWAARR